jgi:hypothetical protein
MDDVFSEPVADNVTTEEALAALQYMRALLDEIERSLKNKPSKIAADALESDGGMLRVATNAGVWEVLRRTTANLRDAEGS